MFRKSNLNKTVYFFFVSLKYREIIKVKTVALYKKIFFIKSLKRKKKKLAVTSFYYVSLGNSKKFINIDQSRLYAVNSW